MSTFHVFIFRELLLRRQHAATLSAARIEPTSAKGGSLVGGSIPPTKSMSMTNLSSAPSGSLVGLQRLPRHYSGDNSDNMSVLSSATSNMTLPR